MGGEGRGTKFHAAFLWRGGPPVCQPGPTGGSVRRELSRDEEGDLAAPDTVLHSSCQQTSNLYYISSLGLSRSGQRVASDPL